MALLPDRILSKFTEEPNTGCWLWHAAHDRDGYGLVLIETLIGPIQTGGDLTHAKNRGCLGPSCVNPAHMEPVTAAKHFNPSLDELRLRRSLRALKAIREITKAERKRRR